MNIDKSIDYIVKNDCSICCEELNKKKNFLYLKCDHIYHFDCAIKYFSSLKDKKNIKYMCPICREEIDNYDKSIFLHYNEKDKSVWSYSLNDINNNNILYQNYLKYINN